MKRLAILLSVFACVGVCLVVGAPDAQAQLVPCCEGGFKPDRLCDDDGDCPSVCSGGFRDGKVCQADGTPKCQDACVGGSNDGRMCSSDAQCPGGSCSDIGTCVAGTCTGLCERRRKKPTPSEPIGAWLDAVGQSPVTDAAAESRPQPCP